GDFDSAQAMGWVRKYFGPLPARAKPAQPDISEPRQEKERRAPKTHAPATRPAPAAAHHAPKQGTPPHLAMGPLQEILGGGHASRLYQALVQKNGLTGNVNTTMNGLGNMYNIHGPTLWTVSLFHDKDKPADRILQVMDEEIEKLRSAPVDRAALDRAIVKMRSDFYDRLEQIARLGRADLLASFALFDDDPSRINRLEGEFRKITPEIVQKTGQEYLRPTNRTILVVEPGAEGKPGGPEAKPQPPAKSGS